MEIGAIFFERLFYEAAAGSAKENSRAKILVM